MVKRKYSKSLGFYGDIKGNFFEENDSLLSNARRVNELYADQPSRNNCKVCQTALPDAVDHISHGVEYVFCTNCGHFNGRHEDSFEFVSHLYTEGAGKSYAKYYTETAFRQRVDAIYLPKLDFLLDCLPQKRPKILDVGCGGGHFVSACNVRGVDARGFDVSETLVAHGNAALGDESGQLEVVSESDFFNRISETDADTITALGVIEHLREPEKFFEAFKQSRATHLFYLVPMFSFAVAIERLVQGVFPRLLSGGHTHLFTDSSLDEMHRRLGATAIAEWRFGADAMDLLRAVTVGLREAGSSSEMIERMSHLLSRSTDDVQSALDRAHMCSEVHCLVSKE